MFNGLRNRRIEAGGELHALCVGRTWLKREAQGQTSRYSHGGISLAELVIPAVRLERVAGKVTAFEFVSLPESIGVDEDDTIEVAFSVKNKGNTEAKLMVTARANLDEELLHFTGELPPSGSHPLKLKVAGTYRTRPNGDIDLKNTLSAINVRLRFSDQSGQWHDAVDGISNITVKVHANKTKLATDALSGFDDV